MSPAKSAKDAKVDLKQKLQGRDVCVPSATKLLSSFCDTMIRALSSALPLVLAPLLWLAACAPTPRLFLQYGSELRQSDLEKVLAEHPLGVAENIKVTTLGSGRGVSHHVVQIRDRERPHLHQSHDGTVLMVKGQGYLMMDKRRIELASGDIVYISRGVPHFFVNTDSRPSVAFVVFSPPFDGKDIVPVPR